MCKIQAFLVVCAALAFASVAHAGPVVVERNSGVLDESALQAETSRWPFALHVLVGDFGTKANLMRAAHECVTAPNVVCVAVDPGHHATQSRFGTGTGVRPIDYELIAAAGNAQFKGGYWREGIEAIADRARDSAASAVATPGAPIVVQSAAPIVNVQAPSDGGSHWVLWTLVALFAGAALVIAWSVRRKQRETEEAMRRISEESDAAVARGEEEREWHDRARGEMGKRAVPTSYVRDAETPAPRARRRAVATTTPAPVTIVNQSGGGGGSSGDLALGYMMGRDAAAPRYVEREVVRERAPSSPSWNSGGAAAEPSSPSYDGGGGGSDFGGGFDSGGGGFDSGGGGFDGGGGGSDF